MFYCDNLKIRDTFGRERIFRGVNLCLKSHWMNGYLARKQLFKDGLFEDMKSVGVNIVRLGITSLGLLLSLTKVNITTTLFLC